MGLWEERKVRKRKGRGKMIQEMVLKMLIIFYLDCLPQIIRKFVIDCLGFIALIRVVNE